MKPSNNMKRLVFAASVIASLGAFAFESWMMRAPDSLGAIEGSAGFKIPYSYPKAIAIPLKDGSHVVVLNQTPYKPGEGKYGSSGIGVPTKVADGNVVSRLAEAAAKIPTVKVNMGGVTWFAVYEEASKMYAGKVVSRGGCFMVYVGLPEGRVFDDEIRAVLAQVELVPPADYGIESALKMYGKTSLLKAAMKYPTLKKMVEERAECVELIEALMGAAKETGHDDTAEWCLAALKKLHPSVYAPDGVNSVKRYDYNDDAQKRRRATFSAQTAISRRRPRRFRLSREGRTPSRPPRKQRPSRFPAACRWISSGARRARSRWGRTTASSSR